MAPSPQPRSLLERGVKIRVVTFHAQDQRPRAGEICHLPRSRIRSAVGLDDNIADAESGAIGRGSWHHFRHDRQRLPGAVHLAGLLAPAIPDNEPHSLTWSA